MEMEYDKSWGHAKRGWYMKHLRKSDLGAWKKLRKLTSRMSWSGSPRMNWGTGR